ncbi:MAG: HAD family hydrolase [Clostridia bacterium]|nr:HAD family hydrolase [Clostridia bacterium]
MKTVLFDLDGTLLPMDQDKFTKEYFGRLAAYFVPYGYDPKQLVNAVMGGTMAMINNDGSRTNEQAFWQTFAQTFGEKVYNEIGFFEEFYLTDFNNLKSCCGYTPQANSLVKGLKAQGCKVILASNPVFPLAAHRARMGWAGLDVSDFDYITSYENSRYCKPNPDYYREIMASAGCNPQDCIMAGNDVTEDMVARTLGLKVYLVTDCIINRKNEDISAYPHGNFAEMSDYLLKI